MIPILNFIEFIVTSLIELSVWAVIIYAILSWLVAFNVVNLRNQAVWQISKFLEAVVRPLLAPFQALLRRILPNLGGLDFSPILFIIVVQAAERFLIPPFFDFLRSFFISSAVI
jgi:YggT family protein